MRGSADTAGTLEVRSRRPFLDLEIARRNLTLEMKLESTPDFSHSEMRVASGQFLGMGFAHIVSLAFLSSSSVAAFPVAQKTKLPRRQHRTERVVLTPVQVRDIAATLNEPARSVTLLLVLTGLRVGELLALRWGSIDLKARLLRVAETVYDGHFDQPKTRRSARTIPIGTETAVILAGICPAAVDAKALVFATREGLPLDRWNLL